MLASVPRVIALIVALLAAATMGPTAALAQGATGIRGRVVDKRSGKPLAGAPVLIQAGGKTENVITDANGIYRIAVPPGTYTVRSYFDMYHGVKITGVLVRQGDNVEVSIGLPRIDESRDVAVQELEIPYRADTTTAAAQDQLRQAASGIGEGLGAKQMSQSGASDAGSAAARVVGVTIESSQLIIRGLGGRYTRVLLNGVPVPSVDPDVPGADLDLFPTGIIDSLAISKVFLPDMPADFAGGIMEIKSVTFPRKLTMEVDLSSGVDSQSTGRDRLDYKGGKYDNFGFDDGRRDIPDAVSSEAPLRTPNAAYPNQEALNQAGRSFRNSWQYRYKSALPKMGVDLTFGDARKLAGRKRLGYLVTAGYEKDSLRRLGISRPNPTISSDGSLKEFNNFRVETGADEVGLTALGTVSLDVGVDHSMTALTLYNRNVTDETVLRAGKYEGGGYQEKWQLQWLARTLWFNQLFGDHRNLFGTRLRLRWAGFHAYGERDEPDRRTVAYGGMGESKVWTDQGGSGDRIYSNLRQDDLGGLLSLRFPLWAEGWGTIGGFAQLSTREFGVRRLRITKYTSNPDGTVYRQPIEQILHPDQVGIWTDLNEDVRPNDTYESDQAVYSGYAMLESPIYGRLSGTGGVRLEAASQEVVSHSPFASLAASTTKRTERSDLDPLPGAALKFELRKNMLLRTAYGMTVARPQIRELAPYQYYDFLRDRGIEGNPDLKRTLIQNFDLRWEWFFGEGEIASASAFYKIFKNPIELTVLDNVTGGSRFQNAERARNLGGELELRFNLGRVAAPLRLFFFESNLALVYSRIELSPMNALVVRAKRPLAGQSPYVANLALRFLEPHRGVTASLVYNVVGRRITDVATLVGNVIPPDIEESTFHSLDFVASAELSKHLKLKARIRNLLFRAKELKQGDFLIQRVDPVISGSLGLVIGY